MLEAKTREITEKKMIGTIADTPLIDEQIQKLRIVDIRKMLETMFDETINGMMLDEMRDSIQERKILEIREWLTLDMGIEGMTEEMTPKT